MKKYSDGVCVRSLLLAILLIVVGFSPAALASNQHQCRRAYSQYAYQFFHSSRSDAAAMLNRPMKSRHRVLSRRSIRSYSEVQRQAVPAAESGVSSMAVAPDQSADARMIAQTRLEKTVKQASECARSENEPQLQPSVSVIRSGFKWPANNSSINQSQDAAGTVIDDSLEETERAIRGAAIQLDVFLFVLLLCSLMLVNAKLFPGCDPLLEMQVLRESYIKRRRVVANRTSARRIAAIKASRNDAQAVTHRFSCPPSVLPSDCVETDALRVIYESATKILSVQNSGKQALDWN